MATWPLYCSGVQIALSHHIVTDTTGSRHFFQLNRFHPDLILKMHCSPIATPHVDSDPYIDPSIDPVHDTPPMNE